MKSDNLIDPKFFKNIQAFRKWMAKNHDVLDEQWVGYYKKHTGIPSINWNESVDIGLCFGWIDGLRKKIDSEAYMIRFTPRRKNSHWSLKNLKRIKELIDEGLVEPSGMEIYKNRKKDNEGKASYEQNKELTFDEGLLAMIKSKPKAWQFFNSLSPYVQKASRHYVMSAKLSATREKRMKILIESSMREEKIPPLNYGKTQK